MKSRLASSRHSLTKPSPLRPKWERKRGPVQLFPIPPLEGGAPGRKILVAEDSPEIRAMVCDVVAKPGDVIFECCSGDEAVAGYRTLNPDVVLMDIELVGMNGLRATHEIRRIDPEARVVVVSQYRSPAFQAAAALAGACGYVCKEELEVLPNLLDRLLQ